MKPQKNILKEFKKFIKQENLIQWNDLSLLESYRLIERIGVGRAIKYILK